VVDKVRGELVCPALHHACTVYWDGGEDDDEDCEHYETASWTCADAWGTPVAIEPDLYSTTPDLDLTSVSYGTCADGSDTAYAIHNTDSDCTSHEIESTLYLTITVHQPAGQKCPWSPA